MCCVDETIDSTYNEHTVLKIVSPLSPGGIAYGHTPASAPDDSERYELVLLFWNAPCPLLPPLLLSPLSSFSCSFIAYFSSGCFCCCFGRRKKKKKQQINNNNNMYYNNYSTPQNNNYYNEYPIPASSQQQVQCCYGSEKNFLVVEFFYYYIELL